MPKVTMHEKEIFINLSGYRLQSYDTGGYGDTFRWVNDDKVIVSAPFKAKKLAIEYAYDVLIMNQ